MNAGWYPVTFGLAILFVAILFSGCSKDEPYRRKCSEENGSFYMVDLNTGKPYCAVPLE